MTQSKTKAEEIEEMKRMIHEKMRESLSGFIGEKNTYSTQRNIVAVSTEHFMHFHHMGLYDEVPNLEALQDEKDPSLIHMMHRDENGELIPLAKWMEEHACPRAYFKLER